MHASKEQPAWPHSHSAAHSQQQRATSERDGCEEEKVKVGWSSLSLSRSSFACSRVCSKGKDSTPEVAASSKGKHLFNLLL
jgi:hypothetical protein